MKISIIGAGPGDISFLTEHARKRLTNAELIITTKRLAKDFEKINKSVITKEISEIADFVNHYTGVAKRICILVSGDVGFYSISKKLRYELKEHRPELINSISSLQFFTSRLGVNYDDIKTVSVHGRFLKVVPFVCYNKKVFVLTGGAYKAHDVVNELLEYGLSDVMVSIGENLSYPNERIVTNTAEKLKGMLFENLAVMLIRNSESVNPYELIQDKDFLRNKTPMTKQEVRTLSISSLNICPGDYIADIGAGTGSVSIELARKAHEGMVFAVEKKAEALEILQKNILKHKAFNIKTVEAEAPNNLELPTLDKAFIGGSSKNLEGIILFLLANNKNIKITVTAVTLETLTEAMEIFKKYKLEARVSQINVSNAEEISGYHLMKSQNPVYIISGGLKNES